MIGSLRGTPLDVLSEEGSSRDMVRHWLARFAHAYLAEMRDFTESVLLSRPTRVTGHDGRQSLALALAAERSFREHKPIAL
jgi:predicted dehydrogenase